MTVFLIILAVIVVLTAAIMSLSATLTVVYENGWKTKVSVLFFEKEISISEILSAVLFKDKNNTAAKDDNNNQPSSEKSDEIDVAAPEQTVQPESKAQDSENEQGKQDNSSNQQNPPQKKPQKSNPIKKLWDDEGIVGILTLLSNVLQTANSAVLTLIRGLHIYSLYVMIISGGNDAAEIAIKHGKICQHYYAVKGFMLSNMKIDNFDEHIQPDFLAPSTEFEMQFIGSISVGLLVKVALKAAFVFIKNLIKNKKRG